MASPKVKGQYADGHSKDRDEHDFYETPEGFTEELLRRTSFIRPIWEPAAGGSRISKVLKKHEFDVFESDLIQRRPWIKELDFLSPEADQYKGKFDIITNPPFKLLTEFAEQAHRLCNQKFALVMPLNGLTSSGRYKRIWSAMPVSKIILAPRGQWVPSERGIIKSQFAHIWAVFDLGHEGPPIFEWTPDVVYGKDA